MNFLEGDVVSPLHTNQVFDPNQFPTLIKELSRKVWRLQKKLGFNALAGCGNSGLLVLGGLAARRQIPFFAVRKSADTEHDTRLANGFLLNGKVTRYLIVDDLISSGTTVNRIVKHISRIGQSVSLSGGFVQMTEPVGVLTYCNPWMSEGGIFQLEDGRKLPTFHIR